MKPLALTTTLARVLAFGLLASTTAWFLGLESLAQSSALLTLLALAVVWLFVGRAK